MDKYFDTDDTEECLNLEMCSIFTPPVCVAKAAPVPITSADELENWLAKQRMPVGTIDQIPQTWCGGIPLPAPRFCCPHAWQRHSSLSLYRQRNRTLLS